MLAWLLAFLLICIPYQGSRARRDLSLSSRVVRAWGGLVHGGR